MSEQEWFLAVLKDLVAIATESRRVEIVPVLQEAVWILEDDMAGQRRSSLDEDASRATGVLASYVSQTKTLGDSFPMDHWLKVE